MWRRGLVLRTATRLLASGRNENARRYIRGGRLLGLGRGNIGLWPTLERGEDGAFGARRRGPVNY